MIPLGLNIDNKIIEFSYERKFNCPIYYLNSCVESSCQCSYIENVIISKINFQLLVRKIYDIYFDKSNQTKRLFKLNFILNGITSTLEFYIIERICSHYKLWSDKSYLPNIEDSYYGKVIKGFKIKEEILNEIISKIDSFLKIEKIEDKVYNLLYMEYGSILPSISNKKIRITKIDKNKISILNKEYYNDIQNKVQVYNNYNGICGVVLKDNYNYYLVDGHNRILSSNKKNVTIILLE